MKAHRFYWHKIFLGFFLFLSLSSFAQEKITAREISESPKGKILFMRHALAPGFGDPQHFKLGDCSTQRNLDEEGRNQARQIGQKLKISEIKPVQIFSSQWCRCLETAELLNLGKVKTHEGLNSFFQGIVDRDKTLTKLRDLMRSMDKAQGPYLFVTHQVVISEITGITPASGEIIIYDLNNTQANSLEL